MASKMNAAQRREALAQAKNQQRRSMLLRIGAPVLAVLVVIAALVVVKVVSDKGSPTPSAATAAPTTAAGSDVTGVLSVPLSTFDSIGAGTVSALPKAVTGTALTAAGKPRVLYIGAEFCPYCAAERWAVAAALLRFGSFSGLGETTSSAGDVYPSTATLSFRSATYVSDVLSFTGVETEDNQQAQLETPTPADQALFTKYNSGNSIPFFDMGNRYVVIGASFDPGVLKGLNQSQIAAALNDPSSPVAKAIDGTANVLTAALCTLTGGNPGAVCTSAGVTAAAAKLPTS